MENTEVCLDKVLDQENDSFFKGIIQELALINVHVLCFERPCGKKFFCKLRHVDYDNDVRCVVHLKDNKRYGSHRWSEGETARKAVETLLYSLIDTSSSIQFYKQKAVLSRKPGKDDFCKNFRYDAQRLSFVDKNS